jgi:NADH pyrophosphatase NudC (nudix superfamily)
MYSKDNLSKLPKMGELSQEAMTAFLTYDKAALADGAIPKKYKELMAIAVALTTMSVLHRSASTAGAKSRRNRAGTGRSCSRHSCSSCRRGYHSRHSSL